MGDHGRVTTDDTSPQPDERPQEELDAFDLDHDGEISLVESERARLGIIDARLEEIARNPAVFKSESAMRHAVARAEVLSRGYLVARRAHWSRLLSQLLGGLGATVGYLLVVGSDGAARHDPHPRRRAETRNRLLHRRQSFLHQTVNLLVLVQFFQVFVL